MRRGDPGASPFSPAGMGESPEREGPGAGFHGLGAGAGQERVDGPV